MSKKIVENNAIDKDCQYSYVMAVVKRAKELRRMARDKNVPLNEVATINTTHIKPLTVALEEFNAGNIGMRLRTPIKEPEKEKVPEVVEAKLPEEEKAEEEKKETEAAPAEAGEAPVAEAG